MAVSKFTLLADLLKQNESVIGSEWLDQLRSAGALQTGRIKEAELQTQCLAFLEQLRKALAGGQADVSSGAYTNVRDMLTGISRSRALQGFTPRETAMFVLALKQPLFNALRRHPDIDAEKLADASWSVTTLLDELGLFTMEIFQKSREEIIVRQQREIAELSTPVVKLWDGILALPLIGTLDSERTQCSRHVSPTTRQSAASSATFLCASETGDPLPGAAPVGAAPEWS